MSRLERDLECRQFVPCSEGLACDRLISSTSSNELRVTRLAVVRSQRSKRACQNSHRVRIVSISLPSIPKDTSIWAPDAPERTKQLLGIDVRDGVMHDFAFKGTVLVLGRERAVYEEIRRLEKRRMQCELFDGVPPE